MAKLCQINRNKKREEMVAKYATKRAALKAVIADKNSSDDEKFEATLKLAESPNSKVVVIGGSDGMPIILGDVK